MSKILASCVLAALMACSNTPPGTTTKESRNDDVPASDLVTTLQVRVGNGSVRFELHVTNPTTQPVTLEFPSGQRYDFVVNSRGGDVVWRWSDGQMFNMIVGQETLAPGASDDYSETWQPGANKGDFTATGRLTTSNRRIEQHADFQIPER